MNSFVNPGQMALTRGGALEAYYTREDKTKTQTVTPSLVMGNGKWGGGVWAERTGLLDNADSRTDRAGAALGMGFAADRMTVGVGYDRKISAGQTNDGTFGMSLNFNSRGRLGFVAGVKATTLINALVRTRTAIFGIGYGFSQLVNAEVFYSMDDLDDTSKTSWGGALSFGTRGVYASGGYTNVKNALLSNVGVAAGRVGVVLGSVDLSAHAEKIMNSAYPWTYGGAFRVMF
jgi:hypothetical protein